MLTSTGVVQLSVNEILAYVHKCGGRYSEWYAGIAKDPRDGLFNELGVREREDAWVYHPAPSESIARQIEAYLVNTLGMDGGTGGGSVQMTCVYAYRKTEYTMP